MFSTTETQWLFEDLLNGQMYTAGIQSVYDLGSSDPLEIDFEYTGTSVDNNVLNSNKLLSNYPNPFNPSTTISFSLQQEELIELEVYNLKGQKVKQLINSRLSAGLYSVTWNGTDSKDQPISSGIYFYKLIVNGKTQAMNKCLLLK